MQTLEEKRALLQRAMDEKLTVIQEYDGNEYPIEPLMWHEESLVYLSVYSYEGMEEDEINGSTFRIVEPRIKAEDLCAAIESLKIHWDRDDRLHGISGYETATSLAKRYREQEAGE